MTYFGFLLRFLVVPILVLLILHFADVKTHRESPRFKTGRLFWIAVGIHILLAVFYTTPWDNYLVATGVWYYNPQLVSGVVLGYVPIEEYTFFVLETLFVGLWWRFLALRHPPSGNFVPSKALRVGAFAVLFAAWATSAVLFFAGPKSFTYLSIIFFWALPAVAPQLLFGADILWHYRKLAALTVLPVGAYLSAVDSLAIADSTWTIAADQSTGCLLGGILPVEEAVFFFITVTLVAFGMTLVLSEEAQERLRTLSQKLKIDRRFI
ncbi:MAG: lycopene cyclase domain-containing protein [Chloroflexi bacterium]|nr:lycopene cyclase domain-containing protein [Chloroflexota bacterium]